ncbi:hypothetical protein NC651_014698 [Populus alba x Populus x berolinensis]|nr:hypothetical protein NC651_014698 [Populus alba x Populus x berolinensis]
MRSKEAKKYFKKDSYLIAYFGDQNFCLEWRCPKIKPFRCKFSRISETEQSNLEDFHDAVSCDALDEAY